MVYIGQNIKTTVVTVGIYGVAIKAAVKCVLIPINQ